MVLARAFLTSVILLSILAAPLFSLEQDKITSIEIKGLKRTKTHAAKYALEKFLGMERANLDLNDVRAAVKDSRILEPVDVELVETPDGLLLRITVVEKWAFFPFPVVMASSSDWDAGLFLADTNAFGLMDMTAAGAVYGNTGWSAMMVYIHTPNRKRQPGWNTFFMYDMREFEDHDREERILRRYSAGKLIASMGLSYPLAGNLSANAAFSYTDISLKNDNRSIDPPAEGAKLLGFSPGLSFNSSRWDGYLLSQRNASLSYSFNLALAGSSYHQLEFRGIFEQPLAPGFRFNLRSGVIWKSVAGSGTSPLFEEGPYNSQVDILPRRFSALRYAGISAGLEKYIIKLPFGTLSVTGSWQYVASHRPDSGFEFNQGPAGGLSFYLSRLALPAFGAVMAYNMNSQRFQFGFNMGMSF